MSKQSISTMKEPCPVRRALLAEVLGLGLSLIAGAPDTVGFSRHSSARLIAARKDADHSFRQNHRDLEDD